MTEKHQSHILHRGSAQHTTTDKEHVGSFLSQLSHLYHKTLRAGDHAAHYWADVSAHSNHPLAGLAAIPGVAATMWTHDTMAGIARTYRSSTRAGARAAQYWADISVHSKHPLAPLASIPGAFAALWTPETAPATAITLGSAVYGFSGVPQQLTHFTTTAGAAGIAEAGAINASRGLGGMFGPGVYMARVGRPLNLFIRAACRTPIVLNTPAGTARIVPYLVYVRWGTAPLLLP
jgi:hypothetical protein